MNTPWVLVPSNMCICGTGVLFEMDNKMEERILNYDQILTGTIILVNYLYQKLTSSKQLKKKHEMVKLLEVGPT